MRIPALSILSTNKKAVVKKEVKKEIAMTAEKVKVKAENKTEPLSFIEPKPYLENIINTLIKNPGLTPMDKPVVFEKNINEIILSELPPHNQELYKNPGYMNYYRLIREKIRSNAYRYYRSKDTGKVLLNFVVLPNGGLGRFSLEEESETSNILREIAIESIKAAAPFPPFPAELQNYTRLSFRIPIYFKNN